MSFHRAPSGNVRSNITTQTGLKSQTFTVTACGDREDSEGILTNTVLAFCPYPFTGQVWHKGSQSQWLVRI